MSLPRSLRKVNEVLSRYYYDLEREEIIHLRPHWSNKHGYHVDVFNLKTLKKEHRPAGV